MLTLAVLMGLEYWGAYNRSSVPHMAWAQTNDRRARSELDLTEDHDQPHGMANRA